MNFFTSSHLRNTYLYQKYRLNIFKCLLSVNGSFGFQFNKNFIHCSDLTDSTTILVILNLVSFFN